MTERPNKNFRQSAMLEQNAGDSNINGPTLNKVKILLMYASAGAGHKIACRAIEQAFRRQGFNGKIKTVDILEYMPSFIAAIFSKGYLYAASKIPWLWYAIYETKSDLTRFKPPSAWYNSLWKLILWRLNRFLKNFKPDYVISSYFASSWAAGRYKSNYNPRCRIATVVTDYGLHPVWLTPKQDRYFVATEENLRELAGFDWYTGVGQDKIKAVGIPIEKKYIIRKNKKELRDKYGLCNQRFTILILAGAYDKKHIESIVEKLTKCNSPLQLLVVARRQFSLAESLEEKLAKKSISCKIFGMIDFLDDLIALADIAITKAGGLTTTECLNSDCPLLIYLPYPGQEERNTSLFIERGVALRLYQLESLPGKIDMLTSHPDKYRAMIKASRELVKPNAADDIAKTVLEDLARKI